MEGKAFGSSGDIVSREYYYYYLFFFHSSSLTLHFPLAFIIIIILKGPNLLWHVKNGLIDNLNPKIWFIMIGTVDIFNDNCSEKSVIANVLNVVKEINERRPEALFVIHGIMPRLDEPTKSKSMFLGKTWKRAQDVNHKLKKFCNKYANMHYIQGGELMLVDSKVRGRAKIDSKMVEDGVHPTIQGYEKWGDYLQVKLDEVYKLFEKFLAQHSKKKKH